MRAMHAEITPAITDDEVAAALAAVSLYLAAEGGAGGDARPVWQVAAVVAAQGGAPARGQPRATWAAADRAGRAGRWSAGLLGAFD